MKSTRSNVLKDQLSKELEIISPLIRSFQFSICVTGACNVITMKGVVWNQAINEDFRLIIPLRARSSAFR